jgi:hypothetical protein
MRRSSGAGTGNDPGERYPYGAAQVLTRPDWMAGRDPISWSVEYSIPNHYWSRRSDPRRDPNQRGKTDQHNKHFTESDMPNLPPDVQNVIATVLQKDTQTSGRFFGHERIGEVYRCYIIAQFLDAASNSSNTATRLPSAWAATILSAFQLTREGSAAWIQLYEHIGSVVAAALTIARRMRLPPKDVEHIRLAALLHDATKRVDIENFGLLANSLRNTNNKLRRTMRAADYPEETIVAVMNTGRSGRIFRSPEARLESIRAKGTVAAVVALADARTIGAEFHSLETALEYYLDKKKDSESQDFFPRHWAPYYHAVESYLEKERPGLSLEITSENIYNETVFPEVFGPSPSRTLRMRYKYSGTAKSLTRFLSA